MGSSGSFQQLKVHSRDLPWNCWMDHTDVLIRSSQPLTPQLDSRIAMLLFSLELDQEDQEWRELIYFKQMRKFSRNKELLWIRSLKKQSKYASLETQLTLMHLLHQLMLLQSQRRTLLP